MSDGAGGDSGDFSVPELRVTYTAGSPPNIIVDGSGNLVYTDADGVDDDITIIVDGANYRIGDPNGTLIAGAGTTQDGNDILVPIASVTGTIQINTQDGNDVLYVDYSGGNFGDVIAYNGGNQTGPPGDILSLGGGTSFASISHDFTNANDGSVQISGNSVITYNNLEPVIDVLIAGDRYFNFNGGAEIITLDNGGALGNRIDSTLGELVEFTSPTNSLTINGGTGDDFISIDGVDILFDADLFVNGNDAFDIIAFQTNATNLGSGNLITTSENLQILADVSTTGAITTTTTNDTFINAIVQTTDGDISMLAGTAPLAGEVINGITINNGSLLATGTGSISLNGTAANDGTGSGRSGVFVGGTTVVSTTTGAINITGDATAAGNQLLMGVRFNGPVMVQTTDGDITVNGFGGSGSGFLNIGVNLFNGATMQATGTGSISLTGTGGASGSNRNFGIAVNGSTVSTAGGGMTLTGIAGTGSDYGQSGVSVENGGTVSDSAAGDIEINGTGGNGTNTNTGITVIGSGSAVTTTDGNIMMTGLGGTGTGLESLGVVVAFDARIESTGAGSIALNGTGGNGTEYSTGIDNTTAIVRTNNGDISYIGNGGNGSGNFNNGVSLFSNTVVESTGTGTVTITGTGGTGIDENNGVLNSESNINSNGGNIAINGTAGNGGYNNNGVVIATGNVANTTGDTFITGIGMGLFDSNNGVYVYGTSIINNTTGNITITGNATTTSSGQLNLGIRTDDPSLIETIDGSISLNGTGGTGTGVYNLGIGLIGSSINASGIGTINLTGFGGSSGDQIQSGIYTEGASSVTSNGGGIIMNGTGGMGNFLSNGITLRFDSIIQDNNGGNISLTGIGGSSVNGGDIGLLFLNGSPIISTTTGDILLNGTAINNAGSVNEGVYFQETPFINSGSGTITMNGTSADAQFSGINITSLGGAITTSGNIIATANTGKLNTPAGIPATVIFDAASTIINGVMAPGQSPGQMIVNGSFNLSSGDIYEWEIFDIANAGTDYDQIVVNGTVDITGSALALGDFFGGTLPEGDEFVIIDNDGTDPVVGTFGPPNNTPIAFNGQFVFLFYDGGDGNDVVLVVDSMPIAICQDYTAELDINGNVTILPSDVDGGSSDADGPVTLSLDNDTFSCADLGANTVTLTVTDNTGNSATCTATVTVVDIIPPTAVCQNITIELDANGNASIVAEDLDGGSTDNCSGSGTPAMIAASPYDELLRYLDPVTYTSISPDIPITVGGVDVNGVNGMDLNPIDGLYYIIVKPSGGGRRLATLDPETGIATTIGGNFPENFASITFTSAGVLYGVTGDGSSTSESLFTIDTATAAITQVLTLGNGSDGESIAYNPDDGLIYHWSGRDTNFAFESINPNTLVVTPIPISGFATDEIFGSQYIGAGQFILANLDEEMVTMTTTGVSTLIGPSVYYFKGLEFYTIPNGGSSPLTFSASQTDFSCADVGDNNIILTVTDGSGNSSTCTALVTVEDNLFPEWVNPPADLTVECDGAGNVTDFNDWLNNTFTGTDNCPNWVITNDSSGLSDDCGETGTETVTFTLTDASGNAITMDATFTIEDTVDPFWDVAPADLTVECDGAGNVADFDAWLNSTFSGSDTCSGSAVVTHNSTGLSDDCGETGAETVTFTLTEDCGNAITMDATFTIEDTTPAVIGCPGDVTAFTEDGDCGAIVLFQNAVAIEECGDVIVYQTEGLGSGSVFPIGDTLIEFTAQDSCGNLSTCTFTVTVVDDDAPTAVCQNITVQLDEFGNASITANEVNFGSFDNCGVGTLEIDIDTFDCSNVGDNDVTLTVTDVNGNSSTCVAVVTVEDVTAPVVACQDIVVELGADGTVTIDPMDVDGGSSDACGIATYELNIDTFGCLDVGDSTVILTVTDVNGNQSSCSATVTVEDNMAPELVCMDVTLELNQDGIAYIIPSQLVETINDPCGVLVFTADVDELYCSDIGTPVTVNIFANDGNGNSSFCSSTVTVVDVLGPQIVCPPNEQVNLDPNGTYTLGDYIGDGIATATDNCTDPVTIFTQDPAAGTTLGFGVQTITFTAEDEYGNVSTCSFELDVQEILGANDSEDFSSLVLYPNPADNKVHLSNPRLMDLNEVTVYDLTGRIVNKVDLSNMGSEITIDVSNLANATYLLVIKGSQGTSTKQLIVNNY